MNDYYIKSRDEIIVMKAERISWEDDVLRLYIGENIVSVFLFWDYWKKL